MKKGLLVSFLIASVFGAFANNNDAIEENKKSVSSETGMIEENISSPSNNVLQLSAQTSTSAPNLQQMEEKLTTWQKIVANLPKISGYLQTGFAYNSLGNHTASFQAKRLRLILDGNVTEKISFRLQIEAFNGIAGSVNGNGQKNLQVMDAFATYKLSPGFQIRAGQFYTPIGYENYDISPATLETVDFSNICYRMVCRNAIGYDFVDYGRDLGIMFMGDIMPDKEKGFSHLSYNFAVTNGHLPAKDDNNKSKDIIAALTVRPVKDFNLKVGYNWGEYKPWNPNSDTFAGVGNYQSMNRFVVGAWYNNPTGLDLRAEFGNIIAKNNGYELVKETGFYLLAAYRIGGYRWLPVLRYDMYHDSVNKYSLNNYNRGLAGLTYQPHPNVKIQLNYLLSFYSKEVADVSNNGKKNSSQLLLMGLFKF